MVVCFVTIACREIEVGIICTGAVPWSDLEEWTRGSMGSLSQPTIIITIRVMIPIGRIVLIISFLIIVFIVIG